MSNSEKRYVAVPRQLQLGDSIFTIIAKQLDDHLGKDAKSELEYFDLEPTIVTDLKLDPDKPKNILINNRRSVPADGKLGREDDDLILNECDARDAVISRIKKEKGKAEEIVKKAERELKAVEDNLAIFTNKTTLNKKGAKVIISGASSVEVEEDN